MLFVAPYAAFPIGYFIVVGIDVLSSYIVSRNPSLLYLQYVAAIIGLLICIFT